MRGLPAMADVRSSAIAGPQVPAQSNAGSGFGEGGSGRQISASTEIVPGVVAAVVTGGSGGGGLGGGCGGAGRPPGGERTTTGGAGRARWSRTTGALGRT